MTITTEVGNGSGGSSGTTNAPAAFTWANRPSAVANNGLIIRITDIGQGQSGTGGGTFWFSNGVRWKLLNNSAIVDAIDTANTSVANTAEQQLNPNRVALPAASTTNGDRFFIRFGASKSGTVDTTTIRVRFGPLGTVADPIIATFTALATTAQSMGVYLEFKRISATSVMRQGSADTNNSFSGVNSNVYPTAVAVSSMDANAMFWTISSQMTAGTETVTIQDYRTELSTTDNV